MHHPMYRPPCPSPAQRTRITLTRERRQTALSRSRKHIPFQRQHLQTCLVIASSSPRSRKTRRNLGDQRLIGHYICTTTLADMGITGSTVRVEDAGEAVGVDEAAEVAGAVFSYRPPKVDTTWVHLNGRSRTGLGVRSHQTATIAHYISSLIRLRQLHVAVL